MWLSAILVPKTFDLKKLLIGKTLPKISFTKMVNKSSNKMSWECHTRNPSWVVQIKMLDQTHFVVQLAILQDFKQCWNFQVGPKYGNRLKQNTLDLMVGDWRTQNTLDFQVGTCDSLAENPIWSPSVAKPSRLLPDTLKTPQMLCLGTSQY